MGSNQLLKVLKLTLYLEVTSYIEVVVVHSIHLAYETRFEKVGVTGARNEKVTQ